MNREVFEFEAHLETRDIFEVVTRSPEETIAFGRELAKKLKPPSVVLLEGELGSGKTTLVKGIVSGLGVASEEDVTSPTFTLVHEYGRHFGRKGAGDEGKVYHVDLYRVDEPRELATLGFEDLMSDQAVVIVEWGEKVKNILPTFPIKVRMEHLGGEKRRILVEGVAG